MSLPSPEEALVRAAQAIRAADALLIGAGAGMGVDSGLPDFRGTEGFWRAYPPLQKLGLSYEALSNPLWFFSDPEQAWGFKGHCRNLYRATVPHEGFTILRRFSESMERGAYVYTSNVDSQFQRAGFADEHIVECHGALNYNQCVAQCTRDIWPAESADVDVDEHTMRARQPLPACPHCGGLARPNVLLFNDSEWISTRADEQARGYRQWLRTLEGARLVIIECGSGTTVRAIRDECEQKSGQLIRINPREPEVPSSGIAVAMGALEGLRRIAAALDTL